MNGLLHADWSRLPPPEEDGAARHLEGMTAPDLELPATDGRHVSLARLPGRIVLFVYPWMGRPDAPLLTEDWDRIPGARGCTPQSCAFRDAYAEIRASGVTAVFGLSVQETAWQQEAVGRLHLPYPLLSDKRLELARALRLPVMEVAGRTLLKRLTFIATDGRIAKVFYPVFPPDRNAAEVLSWLRAGGTAPSKGSA